MYRLPETFIQIFILFYYYLFIFLIFWVGCSPALQTSHPDREYSITFNILHIT